MPISPAILERVGLNATPRELERLLEETLVQMLPSPRSDAPGRELTREELAILEEAGVSVAPPRMDADSPLVRAAAEYAALLATALTVKDTADLLGIDPSRVRQRLLAHTLYGIKHANEWRLPRFQFTEHGLVPGFEQLAPLLVDEHPVAVARWFTQPHLDLVLGQEDDTVVSPREWLLAGHDPRIIVELAAELRDVA